MTTNDFSTFSRVNFRFNFEKVKETSFFLQEFDIPEVSLAQVTVPTQSLDFTIPGEKLSFGETFTMNFLVDENLTSYMSVLNWLLEIRNPEDTMTHREYGDCISDATLSILGNNRQPISRLRFINCWPVSLSGLGVRTTDEVDQAVMATAVFAYAYFKPEPVEYPFIPS